MNMEEWYEERIVKPKLAKRQEWQRVSQEAKQTKLRNKMSKRDIERELRIESLGGKPIEIRYGVPLTKEIRQTRLELEWDLKYPNRNNKKPKKIKKPSLRGKGKNRTQKQFIAGVLIGIRTRAKRKGIPFDLEPSDIKIPSLCPILGIPLKWGEGLTDNTPSIDRIVPEKGYVKGNCKVISMKANRLKSNATPEQFKSIIAYIEQNLP